MKAALSAMIAALLVLAFPAEVIAEESSAGRESLFLLGAGARSVGMGGAYVAVTDEASGVFWNPAGLSVMEYRELSLMHVTLYEETSYDFAAAAWPILNFGTIGVGGIRLGSKDIEFRDIYGPLGTYNYSIGQYWMSYGRRIYGSVCGGVSFKLVTEELGEFSATTASLDAGLQYRLGRAISIGLNLQDILAGDLKLSGVREEIPYNIKFGVAAHWTNPASTFGFRIAADADRTKNQPVCFHLGGELMAAGHLFGRAGYDRRDVVFGGGIRYKPAALDYAYKVNGTLGGTHRLSLSLFFGPTISEQKAKRADRAHRAEIATREATRIDRADELWQLASEAFERNELDSAMVLCSQVLAFDSDHVEARLRITDIRGLLDRKAEEALEALDAQSRERARDDMITNRISAGLRLLEQGKLTEARVEFNEVLKLDPDNKDAGESLKRIEAEIEMLAASHRAEGDSRFASRDYGEAVVAWTKSLELKPDQRDVRERIVEAKRLMTVVRMLQSALEAFSDGDIPLARSRFNEVLEIDADNRTAIEYIEVMSREDIPVVSLQDLKRDQESWAKYVEGMTFFRNKQYAEAMEVWQAVLEKYPGSRETRTNIEQARLRMEQ